jgi:ubiquinone/menaquinone biosynthesis C-methylase UbiE
MNFEQLARIYSGTVANAYDDERSKLEKWASEQRIVESFLATLPSGSSVVDIPVGTGRFVDAYYRLQLAPTGMDISSDMMAIAARKALEIGLNMSLYTADIRSIDAADDSFETAVCICFLNWIDINGAREAFHELVRVARKFLIVSIRHYTPFGKLHPATPKGFLQWALQLAMRVYKKIVHGGICVHEEADILVMFQEHDLHLKRQIRVGPRKYGTDYFIYMLEKPRRSRVLISDEAARGR